ncbi:MAG TPA: lactonase family protein [Chitinophagaceae bacterium]
MRSCFLFFALFFSVAGFSQEFFLFVGPYTNKGGKGIYVYRFNASTGEVSLLSIAAGVENPSYLALSPNGHYLYSVNQYHGEQPSGVSAFSFDKHSGQLQLLNKQAAQDGTAYISVDGTGKWVMAANYTAGSLQAYPVNKDGSLSPAAQTITHKGHSVDTARQEKAHVHSVVFSPDFHFLYSPDLGMDQVAIYKFNPAAATTPLIPAAQPFVKTLPGTGPRHIVFHPQLPYAYLVEEMGGAVSVFSYKNGRLSLLQHISSHPADFKGKKGSADIHLSPDGRFLYASNRGDANSIAIYAVNVNNGKLLLKGFESTLGVAPRNFVIDPTGNYLLVANQETNNIVEFKRDGLTGMLKATGVQLSVPNPVCLKMLARD